MNTSRCLLLVLVGVLLLAGSGCTNASLTQVKPWERATLADPIMNPARDPLQTAMQEHVYFSREAASGGRGVGGAGCGCN